ncbi:MAG: hypothetical protein OIN66_15585 [Candidatus Methanoperedens sp.]|nr:hypothetical protein [Candidatus Methanoperedens sp.]
MKILWVLFALLGISLWYIPNTLSLLSGQHSYYNIGAIGSQIPCQKCHGDVQIEVHTGFIHSNFTCADCHRVQKGVQYASGDIAYERILYVNVTPLSTTNIQYRVLATTISNLQSGNFPKSIPGETTIDQWAGAGNDQVQLRDANNQYAGSMTLGETGVLYNFAYANETETYYNGTPKDTDPLTQYQMLDPRKINVNPDRYGQDNLTGAGSGVITPGTLAHASSTVQCADCHSQFLVNTPDTIHEAFIKYGMEQNTSDNCIACHTAIAVSINWTRPAAISIETTSDGHNITINGTRTAYRARVETFGNQSGDVFAVSNVTVI